MLKDISMRKWLMTCIMVICIVAGATAQDSYSDKVKKYVDAYQDLAIQEQLRSGVPASITLGQGILETEAGCSVLATNANNHFGIKCKKEWRGATFAHTDDAPNECFRKYGCANDSYKDHSDYLRTGTRYASLFKLSPTDYVAWAYGLKKCGYATNPVYAQKLIKIIEDFELQTYTYTALNTNLVYKAPKPKEDRRYAAAFTETVPAVDSPAFKKIEDAADEARASITTTPKPSGPVLVNTVEHTSGIQTVKGLKAIKAYKGDMVLQYAVLYDLRYEKLLEYNDLRDVPLASDMYLYLEKKPAKGKHEQHVVARGETMWQIAQDEPMQLQRLLAYNKMRLGEEPAPGTVLRLKSYADTKPNLVNVPQFTDGTLARSAATKQNDYISKSELPATRRTAEVPTATTVYNDAYVEKPEMAAPARPAAQQADNIAIQQAVTANTNADNVTASTTAPETKETTAPVKVDAPPTTTTQPAAEPQGPPQDELSLLKAKLDRVVYADDNRAAAKTAATAPAKPVTTIAPKPVQARPEATKVGVRIYTVKKGDTAFNIAKRAGMTVPELMELNDLKKATVEIGQRLKVNKLP